MRYGKVFVTALLCVLAGNAAAQGSTATPATDAGVGQPEHLDAVVVTGKVAGPGLWHVYRDDTHDLWIMGTLSPRPAGIEWDASEVRSLVAASQEVLWAPGYGIDVKANLFRQASLGIGYLRARKNPDGRSLKDVLSPDLHARWLQAKARYLPRDSGVERQRPIIAAQALFDAAVKQARLSDKPIVYPAMKDAIEQNGVKSTFPQVRVSMTSAQAKAALADVRRMQLDDEECLAATIDAVQTDIPQMVANANAWATGQVGNIRFAALQRRDAACSDALMKPGFSARYGLPDIQDSIAALWVSEARAALARNASTVAFVPMQNLIGPGNYLDRLRAQGYTVSGP